LTQVNFTIPTNAPLGLQQVVVTVGGVDSKPAALNILAAAGNTVLAAPQLVMPAPWIPEGREAPVHPPNRPKVIAPRGEVDAPQVDPKGH
jgi:hypothetical protein